MRRSTGLLSKVILAFVIATLCFTTPAAGQDSSSDAALLESLAPEQRSVFVHAVLLVKGDGSGDVSAAQALGFRFFKTATRSHLAGAEGLLASENSMAHSAGIIALTQMCSGYMQAARDLSLALQRNDRDAVDAIGLILTSCGQKLGHDDALAAWCAAKANQDSVIASTIVGTIFLADMKPLARGIVAHTAPALSAMVDSLALSGTKRSPDWKWRSLLLTLGSAPTLPPVTLAELATALGTPSSLGRLREQSVLWDLVQLDEWPIRSRADIGMGAAYVLARSEQGKLILRRALSSRSTRSAAASALGNDRGALPALILAAHDTLPFRTAAERAGDLADRIEMEQAYVAVLDALSHHRGAARSTLPVLRALLSHDDDWWAGVDSALFSPMREALMIAISRIEGR